MSTCGFWLGWAFGAVGWSPIGQRIALEPDWPDGSDADAMWFYSRDGAQAGPVAEEHFLELVRQRAIVSTTLVWREGMAEWLPLSKARPELAGPPPLPSAPPPIPSGKAEQCSVCGGWFGGDDLISLSGGRICGSCKPGAVQRLKEGVGLVQSGKVRRRTNEVVVEDGTELPCRCLKCNEPTTTQAIKRKVTWHPPGYYLLILVGVLIYVIVALVIRRSASVSVHLCEHHRMQRNLWITGCWAAVIGGVALIFNALGNGGELGVVFGICLILAGGIAGAVFATLVKPTKIEGKTLWFKGAGKPFLDSLPEQMN